MDNTTACDTCDFVPMHMYFVCFVFSNGAVSTRKMHTQWNIEQVSRYVEGEILRKRAKHDGLASAIDMFIVEERSETMLCGW